MPIVRVNRDDQQYLSLILLRRLKAQELSLRSFSRVGHDLTKLSDRRYRHAEDSWTVHPLTGHG